MYRLHGAIHAYGGTTVSARDTADAVISALSPAAWYRNATGVTSAGGFASQWDDYSGNARHLVQATGTNQPAYNATGGIFTFDGSDNFMRAVFTLPQPVTVIFVGSQISWTAGDRVCAGGVLSAPVIYQSTSSPRVDLYGGANMTGPSSWSVGARGILGAVISNASSSAQHNLNAALTGTAGTDAMGGFCIGANGAGTGSWGNVTAEEAIVFGSALSDANVDSVITALNNALTVF